MQRAICTARTSPDFNRLVKDRGFCSARRADSAPARRIAVAGRAAFPGVRSGGGRRYLDRPDANRARPQAGPVTFTAETDRIYVNTPTACIVDDPVMERRLRVAKEGSNSTVVWNPWTAKAKAMADFGEDA